MNAASGMSFAGSSAGASASASASALASASASGSAAVNVDDSNVVDVGDVFDATRADGDGLDATHVRGIGMELDRVVSMMYAVTDVEVPTLATMRALLQPTIDKYSNAAACMCTNASCSLKLYPSDVIGHTSRQVCGGGNGAASGSSMPAVDRALLCNQCAPAKGLTLGNSTLPHFSRLTPAWFLKNELLCSHLNRGPRGAECPCLQPATRLMNNAPRCQLHASPEMPQLLCPAWMQQRVREDNSRGDVIEVDDLDVLAIVDVGLGSMDYSSSSPSVVDVAVEVSDDEADYDRLDAKRRAAKKQRKGASPARAARPARPAKKADRPSAGASERAVAAAVIDLVDTDDEEANNASGVPVRKQGKASASASGPTGTAAPRVRDNAAGVWLGRGATTPAAEAMTAVSAAGNVSAPKVVKLPAAVAAVAVVAGAAAVMPILGTGSSPGATDAGIHPGATSPLAALEPMGAINVLQPKPKKATAAAAEPGNKEMGVEAAPAPTVPASATGSPAVGRATQRLNAAQVHAQELAQSRAAGGWVPFVQISAHAVAYHTLLMEFGVRPQATKSRQLQGIQATKEFMFGVESEFFARCVARDPTSFDTIGGMRCMKATLHAPAVWQEAWRFLATLVDIRGLQQTYAHSEALNKKHVLALFGDVLDLDAWAADVGNGVAEGQERPPACVSVRAALEQVDSIAAQNAALAAVVAGEVRADEVMAQTMVAAMRNSAWLVPESVGRSLNDIRFVATSLQQIHVVLMNRLKSLPKDYEAGARSTSTSDRRRARTRTAPGDDADDSDDLLDDDLFSDDDDDDDGDVDDDSNGAEDEPCMHCFEVGAQDRFECSACHRLTHEACALPITADFFPDWRCLACILARNPFRDEDQDSATDMGDWVHPAAVDEVLAAFQSDDHADAPNLQVVNEEAYAPGTVTQAARAMHAIAELVADPSLERTQIVQQLLPSTAAGIIHRLADASSARLLISGSSASGSASGSAGGGVPDMDFGDVGDDDDDDGAETRQNSAALMVKARVMHDIRRAALSAVQSPQEALARRLRVLLDSMKSKLDVDPALLTAIKDLLLEVLHVDESAVSFPPVTISVEIPASGTRPATLKTVTNAEGWVQFLQDQRDPEVVAALRSARDGNADTVGLQLPLTKQLMTTQNAGPFALAVVFRFVSSSATMSVEEAADLAAAAWKALGVLLVTYVPQRHRGAMGMRLAALRSLPLNTANDVRRAISDTAQWVVSMLHQAGDVIDSTLDAWITPDLMALRLGVAEEELPGGAAVVRHVVTAPAMLPGQPSAARLAQARRAMARAREQVMPSGFWLEASAVDAVLAQRQQLREGVDPASVPDYGNRVERVKLWLQFKALQDTATRKVQGVVSNILVNMATAASSRGGNISSVQRECLQLMTALGVEGRRRERLEEMVTTWSGTARGLAYQALSRMWPDVTQVLQPTVETLRRVGVSDHDAGRLSKALWITDLAQPGASNTYAELAQTLKQSLSSAASGTSTALATHSAAGSGSSGASTSGAGGSPVLTLSPAQQEAVKDDRAALQRLAAVGKGLADELEAATNALGIVNVEEQRRIVSMWLSIERNVFGSRLPAYRSADLWKDGMGEEEALSLLARVTSTVVPPPGDGDVGFGPPIQGEPPRTAWVREQLIRHANRIACILRPDDDTFTALGVEVPTGMWLVRDRARQVADALATGDAGAVRAWVAPIDALQHLRGRDASAAEAYVAWLSYMGRIALLEADNP